MKTKIEGTVLFQHNTLAALMSGLYEGSLTIGELLEHGDLGIGTLSGIDGELIILDGKAYQARSDKSVVKVQVKDMVPYAAITSHTADHSFPVEKESTDLEIKKQMESLFNGENLFQSIKIQGTFKKMHVRMVPKQNKPYTTPFVEVAKNQPEYTESAIKGTIVGFFTPQMFHGVSVAGYHLHFLSDDKSFGGHVLDFVMEEGSVEIGQIEQLVQHFPVKDKKFLSASLDIESLKADISASE